MSEPDSPSGAAAGLAGLGMAVAGVAGLVACCAGPAVIVGAVGGITLGAVIGGLAGLAVIAASVLAFVLLRRRRRSCEPSAPDASGELAETETATAAVPDRSADR